MYCLAGFSDASRDRPDWEPDDPYDDRDTAAAAARRWIADHPSGRVDVIEFAGSVGAVVLVVTTSGTEVIPVVHELPKVAWRNRPLPQIAMVALFAVGCVLMALDPDASPLWATRLFGALGALLFGGTTAVLVVRYLKARRSVE